MANAQAFTSRDQIRQALRTRGYDEIQILSESVSETLVDACLGDAARRLAVDRSFQVRVIREFGFCERRTTSGQGGAQQPFGGASGSYDYQPDSRFDRQDPARQPSYGGDQYGQRPAEFVAIEQLAQTAFVQGWTQLDFRGSYRGAACERSDLYEIFIQASDQRVDVSRGRFLGACRTQATPFGAPGGFSGAENGDQFARRPGGNGGLEAIYRAVEAQRMHSPHLAVRSYFGACKLGERYELRLEASLDGGPPALVQERYIGRCASFDPNPGPFDPPGVGQPLGPRELRAYLEDQGYRRVFIDRRRGRDYELTACFQVRGFRMIVSETGEIRSRSAAGFCRLTDEGVQIVAPRPLSNEELRGEGRLDPQTCQAVLNWLQTNDPITFRSGSALLDPRGEEIIRRMAFGVDRCGDVTILVEGHTDGTGDPRRNFELSVARASAVANLLIQYGVPHHRVRAAGYGMDHPIASNLSERDRQLNRRIELNLEWGVN